jgi:hypothetical protein
MMIEQWHKTESDQDTKAFSAEFWNRHRRDIESGQFWADRIKTLRGEPDKRLRLAIENLPLPAAFREAAVATRALIREARKQGLTYEDQIALLYWLAAISSFGVSYSEKLAQPGYNVVEAVPGKTLKGLSFTYAQLGYEKLDLLNKTDIKWLVECWGQPVSHSTLHEMHHDVWRKYEDKLVLEQKEQNEKFTAEIKALLSPGSVALQPHRQSVLSNLHEHHFQRRSYTVIAIFIAIAFVCAVWWLAQ